MRKINLFLFALVSASALMFTSCKDECKDITCENGGTCEEGVCSCTENYYGELCADYCENGTYSSGACSCDAGYEGDDCTTISREKFLGVFNADDMCDSGTYGYESTITEGTDIDEINISNFGGFEVTITGSVDGDAVTIETQTDAAGRKFEGSGSINSSGNTVTISYTVTFSNGDTDDCTMTSTRK